MKLLWTFLYKDFVGMFWFLLDKYLGVELLRSKVGICLVLEETVQIFFLRCLNHFILANNVWEFWLLDILQHLVFSVILLSDILVGMLWYITVVLIYISLIINDIEHFFTCLLACGVSSFVKSLFTHLFAYVWWSCLLFLRFNLLIFS